MLSLLASRPCLAQIHEPSPLVAHGTVPTVVDTLELYSVTPNRIRNDGPIDLYIRGAGIQFGAALALQLASQQDIIATDVAVAPDGMSLGGTVDVAGAAYGYWNVVVTNPDGRKVSGLQVEVVRPTGPPPTITGIFPNRGVTGHSVNVVISGTGFFGLLKRAILSRSTGVWISGIVTRTDSNGLWVTFDLTSMPTGPWDVMVINDDLQSATLPRGFLIDALPLAPPRIGTVAPRLVFNDRPATLLVSGTGFLSGAAAQLTRYGETIAGTQVSVSADSLSLEATFDVTGKAPSTWDVAVINPDGQKSSRIGRLIVSALLPKISRVVPDSASNEGPVTLTVLGSAFSRTPTVWLERRFRPPTDSSLPTFGRAVQASAGGDSLTATFDLTGATAGVWDLFVENPVLQIDTLARALVVKASTTPTTPTPTPALALAIAGPNPIVGVAGVAVVLPSFEPAALEVFDVSGRALLRRNLGVPDPGWHLIELGDAVTRPGLYVVRLRQGSRVVQRRVAVIH